MGKKIISIVCFSFFLLGIPPDLRQSHFFLTFGIHFYKTQFEHFIYGEFLYQIFVSALFLLLFSEKENEHFLNWIRMKVIDQRKEFD